MEFALTAETLPRSCEMGGVCGMVERCALGDAQEASQFEELLR